MNISRALAAGSFPAFLAAAALLVPASSASAATTPAAPDALAAAAAPSTSQFGAWAHSPADVPRLSNLMNHPLTSMRVYYDTPPARWTSTGILGAIPDNGTVAVSFHSGTPAQIKTFLSGHPSSVTCYATYYHEPEFAFTTPAQTAQFRATWSTYAPSIRQAGCIPTLIVGGWLMHDPKRDWHDWYPAGSVDALGFDSYNHNPDGAFPPADQFIAPYLAASVETGLPWAMPEVGTALIPSGIATSATRAAWAHSVAVAAYRDPGFLFADWWDSVGSDTTLDFRMDDALGAAWHVDPATAPAGPATNVARAGDTTASLTWTPADDGGTPITGYTVTATNTATSATTSRNVGATATSGTVPGLVNGQTYQLTVTAVTRTGRSPASAPSNAVVPTAAVAPGAPTIIGVTRGDSSATATFTAPASDGRSAITSYTVAAYDRVSGAFAADVDTTGTATTGTVSGLTNATSYALTVTATNAVGTGPESAPSGQVTPATVPDQTVLTGAAPGDTTATATWTAPDNGGTPLTGYTVTAVSTVTGNPIASTTVSGPATSGTVGGLINGRSYTLTVSATNSAGTGATSAASATLVPRTVADAPTIGVATPGVSGDRDTSATATWTKPAYNGSATLTNYLVTADRYNGATLVSSTTFTTINTYCTLKFTGLTAGATYRFHVQANNAAGTGDASAASNLVTAG